MNEFRKLLCIELCLILAFFALKQTRPFLTERFSNPALEIFLYSFPNFAEGVVGVLTLSMILVFATQRLPVSASLSRRSVLVSLAFAGAAIYVISQELNWHQIGGANTYDPYDIIFSVIGLCVGVGLFWFFDPAKRSDGRSDSLPPS